MRYILILVWSIVPWSIQTRAMQPLPRTIHQQSNYLYPSLLSTLPPDIAADILSHLIIDGPTAYDALRALQAIATVSRQDNAFIKPALHALYQYAPGAATTASLQPAHAITQHLLITITTRFSTSEIKNAFTTLDDIKRIEQQAVAGNATIGTMYPTRKKGGMHGNTPVSSHNVNTHNYTAQFYSAYAWSLYFGDNKLIDYLSDKIIFAGQQSPLTCNNIFLLPSQTLLARDNDNIYLSPLMHAIWGNHPNAVKCLLDKYTLHHLKGIEHGFYNSHNILHIMPTHTVHHISRNGLRAICGAPQETDALFAKLQTNRRRYLSTDLLTTTSNPSLTFADNEHLTLSAIELAEAKGNKEIIDLLKDYVKEINNAVAVHPSINKYS